MPVDNGPVPAVVVRIGNSRPSGGYLSLIPKLMDQLSRKSGLPMILGQASAFLSTPMRAHPATSGRLHVASVDCHDPQSRDVGPVRTDEAA